MQNTRRALFATTFALSIMCLGQQSTTDPSQPNPPAPVRDLHSSTSDLTVPLCPTKFDDSLAMDGIAAEGDKSVTPPKVAHLAEAEFSDEARRELGVAKKRKNQAVEFNGVSAISLVVDEHGKPRSLCLRKSVGYGLDENAAKAVQESTFDPATKDGKPVSYRLSIKVDFTLY